VRVADEGEKFALVGESMTNPKKYFHNNFINALKLTVYATGEIRAGRTATLVVPPAELCE